MKMNLRYQYLNGPFGDPALYLWEINTRDAILVDCGDLSRFTTRQLLKVGHIFLSHAHIDHFFGFDHFLRIHVGSEKHVTIYGPPETSKRVSGKLQGYTWNLVWDQNLQFTVVDLDTTREEKIISHFHAKDGFSPGDPIFQKWKAGDPVLDTTTLQVLTTTLDHRTPSMAYLIREKMTVSVSSSKIKDGNFETGSWLHDLKVKFLDGRHEETVTASYRSGETKNFKVSELAKELLMPRQTHQIAYATDGAANDSNFLALKSLISGTDIFFSETCFMESDRPLADETKHFTAKFIAELSKEAKIKILHPFHFSKRYLGRADEVYSELAQHFDGQIIRTENVKREVLEGAQT